MSRITEIAHCAGLWLAILAGLVLPALFSIGYRPLDLEIVIIIAAAALLAVAATLAFQAFLGSAENLMAAAVVALGVHIYYLPDARPLGFVLIVACSVVVASILSRGFIFIASVASLVAIIFAGLNAPSFWRTEIPLVASTDGNQPAVVHLLLDEFAAPEGMPRDVLPGTEIDKIVDWYVAHGFQIFMRSFSLYSDTKTSFAQLSNTNSSKPKELVKTFARGGGSELTSAETFAMIAKRWQIRAITGYVDIMPALAQAPNPVSGAIYNSTIPSPTVQLNQIPASDRFQIAGALLHSWLRHRQGVDLYNWLIRVTGSIGRAADRFAYAKNRISPLGSMVVLERLIASEIPRLKRGQYLFSHIILPHYPYAFTKKCRLRPVSEWRNNTPPKRDNTLKSRTRHYRLYFEQVMCLQLKLDDLFAAISRNPELHDAVVIVHGDHGSRIVIESWKNLVGKDYDEGTYLRDGWAAFFAVRLSGKPGQRVNKPLAIHDLFGELVTVGFSSLDIGAIKRRSLSYRMFASDE